MLVWYKYNIILNNLVIKKYRRFVYMCMYCYHVIQPFVIKLVIQEKKIVKLVLFQAFID